MALIGYARVSTVDQDPQLQIDALRAAGVKESNIFTDHGESGANVQRPALELALAYMRDHDDDTLVVWKLDRLGRSTHHLVNLVEELRERGIGFRSLTEGIDTTTSGGQFFFTVFAGLAQLERDMIRERTLAGLKVAQANGNRGGRPTKLTTAKRKQIATLSASGTPKTEIATMLGLSRPTVYRALQATRDEQPAAQ